MTLTKPALRTSLGDLHFSQAAWVAFNSPPIHMRLILRPLCDARWWMATIDHAAVMKDGGAAHGAARACEVLERKGAEHKPSFVLGKDTEVG